MFSHTLLEAVGSLQGGIELRKPDRQFDVENKPQAYARAASDNDVLDHFAVVLEDWCTDIESILGEQDRSKVDSEESGPDTEFEYWRNRMAKFNSIAEQLKRKECKMVLGVLLAAKHKSLKRWKVVDNAITDSLNEAKDNVKYLSTEGPASTWKSEPTSSENSTP